MTRHARTLALLTSVTLTASVGRAAEDCRLAGQPSSAAAVELKPWATGFDRPIKIVALPSAAPVEAYYVAEQPGVITRIERPVAGGAWTKRQAVDLRDRVTPLNAGGDERGLLGLALHPAFAQNGRVFVNYTTRGSLRTHVSEFKAAANGAIDKSSERLLLEFAQPYSNHNGGDITFGPDGMLFVAAGDGGSGGDPQGNGQNLRTLLGKILRLDVGPAGATGLAQIPKDNPFVDRPGARGEIWAYGLRNPWRIAFDRASGELWAADVGQNLLEEVDLIKKGANYGWNVMEADTCFNAATCDRDGLELPVFRYARSDGYSITGGYVYRGVAISGLAGAYVFGDYGSGKIWALRRNAAGAATASVIAESERQISAFGEDKAGEMLVLDIGTGAIVRLAARVGPPPPDGFPRKLSETGCFGSLSPLVPAEGLLPLDVAAPLWSDGLGKDRYLRLPDGARITRAADGTWAVPAGTVLVKHFRLPTSSGERPVETRFLVKRAGGTVDGYSYRWLDDGTDAVLLAGAASSELTIHDQDGGGDEHFSYYFPSGFDCRRCHAPSLAGVDGGAGVLGMTPKQLNIDVVRDGATVNQLAWLASARAIDPAAIQGAPAPFPDPRSASATVESRARAWLHVQCAGCHHPGGDAGQATLDLRASLSLARMNACNVAPRAGDLGIDGARLVVPHDVERSVLAARIAHPRKDLRMPPIATSRYDRAGIDVVKAWIAALPACD
jgi:uncharacterized repeat protein (TIGR03806 family)